MVMPRKKAPSAQKQSKQAAKTQKKAASKPAARKSKSEEKDYKIQSSAGNRRPTAKRPGRYDVAGKYMGASSPVQTQGGGGMSAKMAASIQESPSNYQGYQSPAGGTPTYYY